nr:MAG TPA: Structural protein [Caudoviricetes sp.]
MSDQLMHYGVKGMRRGTRKSREERNAERRAKYEAKLKAKYGDNDIGKIETYLKIRKEHAEKVKKWRQANQRNRQLTATERREKYYGELDRGKLGKTYSTDATLAEAARKFYKKGHNKRMGHSELMHYGVKGMKWGVRKRRIKNSKKWSSSKQAKIDGMSDDQLRRINNRIRLEKEYRQLTQTRMERYRNKAGKAAEEAAFNTLQNAIQKGLKKAASQGGSAAIKGAKRFKHSETGMSSNIFFIDEDEVLAHHGVKGMRWGVRKQRPSGGAGPTKKRKGLSRKQKAAIAGVLGTAAAVGGGYYLHKSGNGKKITALAKKQGAAAKKFTQGKGRNLGAQARVKKAQAKRFAKAQSATAKGAAEKLKQTKAGKYAEATRLGANAAKFKVGAAARSAGYKAKNQAWKASNSARNAAKGGASGVKSAAGSAASAAKSKFGKKAPSKAPSKALSTAVRSGGAGRRKLAVSGTKVVGRGDKTLAKNLAKIGAVGVGAHATGVVAGRAAAKAAGKKLESTGKRRQAKNRR